MDIPAPAADIWSAFTTSEGFMSWAVPKAEVDLRVGGEMRTSYNPESNLNDEHTIVNTILAYEPERMLSMRNAKAPAGFANAHLFQQTWSVIYFEPVTPSLTHIRIVGLGYGDGPEWDDIYKKFEVGNAYTLKQLHAKFAPDSGNDGVASAEHHHETALDILHQLVGGEWIHESEQAEGGLFRVRNVLTMGPDSKSIIGRGWLGDADGMFDHGTTVLYREPGTQRTRFFNINEAGGISQGDVRAISEGAVEWDWHLLNTDGENHEYKVVMTFSDADHYLFELSMQDEGGAWQQVVSADFKRVEKTPDSFLKMRSLAVEQD